MRLESYHKRTGKYRSIVPLFFQALGSIHCRLFYLLSVSVGRGLGPFTKCFVDDLELIQGDYFPY